MATGLFRVPFTAIAKFRLDHAINTPCTPLFPKNEPLKTSLQIQDGAWTGWEPGVAVRTLVESPIDYTLSRDQTWEW